MASRSASSARRRSGPAGDREPPGLPTEPDRLDELGFAFCVRKLTAAARTEHELVEALTGRGYPDDSIQRIVARLKRIGYVDDELFAQMWVDSRHRGRGLSRRALTNELRRRGVERPTLEEAVERVDSGAERARAEDLVRARLRSTPQRILDDRAALLRRLVGLLARKGYGSSLAYAVVTAVVTDVLDAPAESSLDEASPGPSA